MGLQRSVQESAIPQGWVRPVRQKQGQGILIEALGRVGNTLWAEKAV